MLFYYSYKFINTSRSSHRRGSIKKMLLKISQILQENTYVELPFNKVTGLQGRNVVKKKSPTKVFPIELANILITPVLVL